jgi:hypothetical protein
MAEGTTTQGKTYCAKCDRDITHDEYIYHTHSGWMCGICAMKAGSGYMEFQQSTAVQPTGGAQDLRMQCLEQALRLAMSSKAVNLDKDVDITKTADRFYNYIVNGPLQNE